VNVAGLGYVSGRGGGLPPPDAAADRPNNREPGNFKGGGGPQDKTIRKLGPCQVKATVA